MMCLTKIWNGKKFYWHETNGWSPESEKETAHVFNSAVVAVNYAKKRKMGTNYLIEAHPGFHPNYNPGITLPKGVKKYQNFNN